MILDLWGVSFHAVVVFGLGKDFLFKSTLGHCGLALNFSIFYYEFLNSPDQAFDDNFFCQIVCFYEIFVLKIYSSFFQAGFGT